MKWMRIFFFVMVVASGVVWYVGLLPIFDGPARAGVRHALNLQVLPMGVTINGWGEEAGQDYVFEADFNISPDQLKKLLSGRKFKVNEVVVKGNSEVTSGRIDKYVGFEIAQVWDWVDTDSLTWARVCTNEARDRVLVCYVGE